MIGVWQAGRGEVGPAVQAALETGYRHIDGAWRYAVSAHRIVWNNRTRRLEACVGGMFDHALSRLS